MDVGPPLLHTFAAGDADGWCHNHRCHHIISDNIDDDAGLQGGKLQSLPCCGGLVVEKQLASNTLISYMESGVES